MSLLSRGSVRLIHFPLLMLLAMTGCSGGGGTTVSGTVTLDGVPMTKGSVRFIPDAAKGNKSTVDASGIIDANGKYTLATAGKPGAALGWYKVVVAAGDIPESSRPNEVKTKIASAFLSPEQTPLSIEVVSSPKPDAYDLKLTSK